MRRMYIALVTVLTGTTLLLAPPTSATTSSGSNCVVKLVPTDPDQVSGIINATEVDLGCYATYAEALRVGSRGSIQVSSSMRPRAMTQASLTASTTESLAADVLIGTEFDATNYAAGSKSYFASETCSAGVTWDDSYVGDTWNDRFQSGKGFGGCDTNKKFQNSNFGGTVITCTPNCPNYSPIGNDVSSLRWKP